MSSSAIPPAPPPAPLPTGTTGGAVLAVVAGAGAEALAKLPSGSVVTAALVAVEAKALIQVETSTGQTLELRLPPNITLPDGADLTLQLVQQGGSAALKLLAVNGRPFPFGALGPGGLAGGLAGGLTGPGGGLLPGAADLLAPATGGGNPLQALGRGGEATGFGPPLAGSALPPTGAAQPAGPVGLTATIIRSGPAGAVLMPPGALPPGQTAQPGQTPPPGLADLAPGTQLTVRIAGLAPPGGGMLPPLPGQPPPAPPATPPGQPASPQPGAAPGTMTTPPQSPAAPLPAGPTPAPPTAPQQAAPPVPTPANPTSLDGAVISHSPGGNSLVQTPAGVLSLTGGPAMAVGTGLRLEVVGPPIPPPASPAAAVPQGLTAAGWPTLENAVDVLAQLDRQAASQLIQMIPQATPRLAAAMSLFAGAVRSGDFKQLAADGVTRGLDRAGRRDLADRLKRDFMALAEDAQRPRGDGDWQAITLPFAHGAQIDPIRLFVQRVSGEDKGRGGGKGQEQRFIVEVQMSRLGRIQFDGLIQKEAKRFDLIVRSAQPLGAEICRDISGIFAECAQLTGIKGSVGFQSGRSFVELPPTDAKGTRIVV